METNHRIYYRNASDMRLLADETVSLVVTSPPYPMITMWDRLFVEADPEIEDLIASGRGFEAFESMHRQLDTVWQEMWRIVAPGGIVCIDVGDAVRTVGKDFGLYPNHARILSSLVQTGFTPLPSVLWRKPTNAPNKFMGSGMLPAGAYVTLEHETVLVVRKGGKRAFCTPEQRALRRESAYFWEERNRWFSDVWTDLRGASQAMAGSGGRSRSAAFPFEIPYRLISMFSVKKDLVLDPFMGTGATLLAAMVAGRNCVGFETDRWLASSIDEAVVRLPEKAAGRIRSRLQGHRAFVEEAKTAGRDFRYENRHYGFPVMTAQETDLLFNPVANVAGDGEKGYRVTYKDAPGPDPTTDVVNR
jgi:DNA modification methylase